MARSRVTLTVLVVAGLVVASAIILDQFPEMTSDFLNRLAGAGESGAGHNMKGMGGR
jgi:hypothetical protein